MLEKLKDILAVCREGLLVILFLLLILFPSFINTMLTNAGFTQGSVMGFTWQEKAIQSKQAADSSQKIAETANQQLVDMHKNLDEISKKLVVVGNTTNNPEVQAIKIRIDSSKEAIKTSSGKLDMKIQEQRFKLDNIFNGVKMK